MGLRAMAFLTALFPSVFSPDARRSSPMFSQAEASLGLDFTARLYNEMASSGSRPVRRIARLNSAGS